MIQDPPSPEAKIVIVVAAKMMYRRIAKRRRLTIKWEQLHDKEKEFYMELVFVVCDALNDLFCEWHRLELR